MDETDLIGIMNRKVGAGVRGLLILDQKNFFKPPCVRQPVAPAERTAVKAVAAAERTGHSCSLPR